MSCGVEIRSIMMNFYYPGRLITIISPCGIDLQILKKKKKDEYGRGMTFPLGLADGTGVVKEEQVAQPAVV